MSRYLRYQFCMEKAYGQGFYQRLGIDVRMNQWGVAEPTFESIVKQPDPVRQADARCRRESDIATEARPDF